MSKEMSLTIKLRTIENYFYLFIFLLVLPLCLAVGSYSWTRDRTCALCSGSMGDHHWTTKEILKLYWYINITETGVQIGDFKLRSLSVFMINRDLNSSGSPMNCAYFIDRIEWSCQITKSSKVILTNYLIVRALLVPTRVISIYSKQLWKNGQFPSGTQNDFSNKYPFHKRY